MNGEPRKYHASAIPPDVRKSSDRQGPRPVAAVIPVPVYERLVAERLTRFDVIERVRTRLPKTSPEVLETDVREAVAKVRSRHAPGRS